MVLLFYSFPILAHVLRLLREKTILKYTLNSFFSDTIKCFHYKNNFNYFSAIYSVSCGPSVNILWNSSI